MIASGQLRSLQTGHRVVRWFAIALPPILVGYAFFDKGFAYISIPGTRMYAGELLVVLALAGVLLATGYAHKGIQHSTLAKMLLAFAAFGAVKTVPQLGTYGIDAIRDAALWYYALLAIPVCALVICEPGLLERWTNGYRRIIPWMFVYSPLAFFLGKQAIESTPPPIVPGSTVSFWRHEPGNTAVQTTIAVAFLWLVPGISARSRALLTGLATAIFMIGATQNRGGLVAAVGGLGLVWLFARRRGRLTLWMIATVFVFLVIGWGLNIQLSGEQGRVISVEQLIQNIGSISGEGNDAAGNLQSNVQFRNQLWSATIKKVQHDHKVMTGLGFGPNVAQELGFEGQAERLLRSPHNSHVDVFARMGVIGAAMWLALWTAFYSLALRGRVRLRAAGRAFEMGLVEVCIVGVTAILINAYFDPTLESPQQAIWLWTLVGITMGLVAISRRSFSGDQQLVPTGQGDVVVAQPEQNDHYRPQRRPRI